MGEDGNGKATPVNSGNVGMQKCLNLFNFTHKEILIESGWRRGGERETCFREGKFHGRTRIIGLGNVSLAEQLLRAQRKRVGTQSGAGEGGRRKERKLRSPLGVTLIYLWRLISRQRREFSLIVETNNRRTTHLCANNNNLLLLLLLALYLISLRCDIFTQRVSRPLKIPRARTTLTPSARKFHVCVKSPGP